jgi:hypothetical protein
VCAGCLLRVAAMAVSFIADDRLLCAAPAREPGSSWLGRRSTMATSTPANANSSLALDLSCLLQQSRLHALSSADSPWQFRPSQRNILKSWKHLAELLPGPVVPGMQRLTRGAC